MYLLIRMDEENSDEVLMAEKRKISEPNTKSISKKAEREAEK
jgi:hypothetical protein